MLTARTVADAARAAGVSERTAFRYLSAPGARAAIERERERAFAEGGALLKALFGEAVDVLAKLARESKDDEVRCRAAGRLVELAVRYEQAVVVARKVDEQEERLRALEALAPRRRVA